MIPYNSSEDGNGSQSTIKIQNFAIALGASSTYRLFGLGVTSGTGRAEVYFKNLTTGAANDLDDNGWTESANNASSSGATDFKLFTYYARTGLIYGARAGSHIWEYDPTGGTAWADTARALTYTNMANGIVHSEDDILYIGYDNFIASNNNGSWNNTALTLPTELVVKNLTEYGNYLVIACDNKVTTGKSQVFLWDKDSTLVEVNEIISWGDEDLRVLEEIEGELVGISIAGGSSEWLNDRIIFRRYVAGLGAVKFLELPLDNTGTSELLTSKQKLNGRLYFQMQGKINGSQIDGVWSIGRSPRTREWALLNEVSANNDTAIAGGDPQYNFQVVGDYTFQSFSTSTTDTMTKTTDGSTYSATSIWESLINPSMESSDLFKEKELVSVTVHYEAQPANGQVVLKYRTDRASSYTTVFTDTTNSSTFTERTADTNGTDFTNGREFEFRIESTGGTVITGFTYEYRNLKSEAM
jgi:hypothetical protein